MIDVVDMYLYSRSLNNCKANNHPTLTGTEVFFLDSIQTLAWASSRFARNFR